MNWAQAARDSYYAAQTLKQRPRSCMSRSYFAAYSAVTQALIDSKRVSFPIGFEGPSHRGLSDLIENHLTYLFARVKIREMKAAIRRLYSARLDADYRISATIGETDARNALRDAYWILRELGIPFEVNS
ncbi:MAG TPA: hypothetical protein VKX17_01510 [Planctomycetota bacterium]|nr:hypothetical protein [Planctomycetota bacterium]